MALGKDGDSIRIFAGILDTPWVLELGPLFQMNPYPPQLLFAARRAVPELHRPDHLPAGASPGAAPAQPGGGRHADRPRQPGYSASRCAEATRWDAWARPSTIWPSTSTGC